MPDQGPMTDGRCGDPELSQELRDALTLLREHSDNDDFHTLVDDLLAGRCGLVEASGTAAFSDVVFAGIAREIGHLTEDEKRRLAAPAESSAAAAESCATPCADCSGVCALRGSSSQ
ncbi:MAG: hypothetical protein JO063_09245 [Pseudonocardiales bacterium]|nr:hypothetical protein [Pseudonocardiales bacterium]MBW0010284.1 hypothetical protein [Pseudonocardiales bacterium]